VPNPIVPAIAQPQEIWARELRTTYSYRQMEFATALPKATPELKPDATARTSEVSAVPGMMAGPGLLETGVEWEYLNIK